MPCHDKVSIEQPGVYDVISSCRTQKAFDHVGNRRFRVIIENHTRSYDRAKSRLDRSIIVNTILETIQNGGGNFIRKSRKDPNLWEVLPLGQTKEKIGHALRESIVSQEQELKKQTSLKRDIYSIIGGFRNNKFQLEMREKKQLRVKETKAGNSCFSMIEHLAEAMRPPKASSDLKTNTNPEVVPGLEESLEDSFDFFSKDVDCCGSSTTSETTLSHASIPTLEDDQELTNYASHFDDLLSKSLGDEDCNVDFSMLLEGF